MKKLIALFFAIGGIAFVSCNNTEQSATTVQPDSTSKNEDWTLGTFTKADSVNPVLQAGNAMFIDPILKREIKWENKDVFNPAIVVRDGKIHMLYRAEDTIGKYAGTSRIGLAVSSDGLHFVKQSTPVLFPAEDDQKQYEWEGGCEDPRVVEDDKGIYFMTYTSYDGKTARLLVASSTDLQTWKKHGPAFAKAYNGKYKDLWSKSGSIVSTYEKDGKIVARKINGKYWMYWGDVNIWAATSDDLINWTPLLYEDGEKATIELRHYAKEIPEMRIVFGPRPKKFDSDLVEPGPPAMITPNGILLIYNSRNVPAIGDSALVEGTYAASQILLDSANPAKVLKRMESYFIKPDKPYEISGQVNQVCFLEGLARFNNNWYLYYGTADSKIAVAVAPQK
ncbi:MAG: glycosidase [Chitinophagaceae bacterium]|nr:glycosidase [Chitinophagaceae bacterium]